MALQPKSNVVNTKPAPVGGLNARDALSAMPETDAVDLINWIPDAYGVRCRKGYAEWATNLGDEVQSVFCHFAPTDTYPGGTFLTAPTTVPGKLFAATKAGIYTITTTTDAPVLAQALASSTYSGWFSTSMLTNTAGAYLLCCSEDDGYFTYDGTTWVKRVAGAGAGQINGVDPADLCFTIVWKRRAWFVEKNTSKAWYLPTDQITGTVAAFDFGPLFKKGGHLSYLASWTIDAGEGIDDFLVAVSSNGDVVIYKGTDPSSSTAFALVGTWNIGTPPVGRRAFAQFGGDLVLTSADGIFPISYVTRGGAAMLQASSKEYSSKIRARIGPVLRATFTDRGWDMMLHPSERLMMINVPNTVRHRNAQYAMNTTVNEWCMLQDIPVTCYGESGGYVFSGTADGRVLLLFNSSFDNVPYGETEGDGIYGLIQPAFSSFGTPAIQKQFLMVRPYFIGAAQPGVVVGLEVDYKRSGEQSYPAYSTASVATFGTGRFDSARWATAGGTPYAEWVGVGGVGSAAAIVLQTACGGDTVLTAIDYLYRPGGIL